MAAKDMDSDAKETPGYKILRMDKFQYSVATLKLSRKITGGGWQYSFF